MTTEACGKIIDEVAAELVECAAPPPVRLPIRHLRPDDETPTDRARAAVVQQVGAEPPPAR